MLDRVETNGVSTVIVEDASRFARELMTQELGILALIRRECVSSLRTATISRIAPIPRAR